jgi:hypothetical protein
MKVMIPILKDKSYVFDEESHVKKDDGFIDGVKGD